MKENLFDHIDIPAENIHIPDGTIPFSQIEQYSRDYEKKIKDVGGIDLMVIGIGRSGQLGLNEPDSHKNSKTRVVDLQKSTRIDAARCVCVRGCL